MSLIESSPYNEFIDMLEDAIAFNRYSVTLAAEALGIDNAQGIIQPMTLLFDRKIRELQDELFPEEFAKIAPLIDNASNFNGDIYDFVFVNRELLEPVYDEMTHDEDQGIIMTRYLIDFYIQKYDYVEEWDLVTTVVANDSTVVRSGIDTLEKARELLSEMDLSGNNAYFAAIAYLCKKNSSGNKHCSTYRILNTLHDQELTWKLRLLYVSILAYRYDDIKRYNIEEMMLLVEDINDILSVIR